MRFMVQLMVGRWKGKGRAVLKDDTFCFRLAIRILCVPSKILLQELFGVCLSTANNET